VVGAVEEVEWTLLRGLPPAEVEEVFATARRRRFGRREVVWHEGDRADTVHFIRSGRIAVQALTPLGEVATIAVHAPGNAAGLIAVNATDPYHSTGAIALEPTQTMAIRVDDLQQVRRRVPAVDDAIVRFLADRVLDMTSQLVDALYVSADTRVLRRLSMLVALYDRGEPEVVVPLTQEDLAGLAGVTRPTANRVLKKEEQRGVLRLSRGAITVLDRARLASRAT
jgi:CRP/FNR family transcriptional regulator, cyclic AMP receptor protein